MTKQELYIKYLELANYLENLYRNSDLDIVDVQFENAKDKLLMFAYMLGFRKVSKKNVGILEKKYYQYKDEIEKARI
ncbi:MAG: hypothetical protein IIZ94_04835 [Prevotella sp.]|nr:hypothetical protein [Prevotella sp.]